MLLRDDQFNNLKQIIAYTLGVDLVTVNSMLLIPPAGEYYWIEADGEICSRHFDKNSKVDRFHAETGNFFKTRKEAEKAIRWLKAFAILRNAAGDDPKGNHSICVYRDGEGDLMHWDCVDEVLSPIRFKRDADAEDTIKAYEREWLIFFGLDPDDEEDDGDEEEGDE